MKAFHTHILLLLVLLGAGHTAVAQYKVRGTVLDSSRNYPLQAVSVMTTSGRGTITDGDGQYTIEVNERDSIWFSYLGKPTPRYAVLKIADVTQFDIALKLKADVMEEVRIKNRSYRMDSIQNRKDYAKIFNYQKVSVGSMTSVNATGAGFDIQELIRLFQFRKNKATLKFQQRLLEQEREKFIDHRFNKGLVMRLTNLDGEELDLFMQKFRPSYEFTAAASDYDFQLYIKKAFEAYQSARSF